MPLPPTTAMDADLARLASVNLNLLVPLLALLEERSVTRAADKVGLSQPAMSHALRRLRRLLGDELLVRQGSGMRLTPLASELLDPLERVLHSTARLVNATTFDPVTTRRTITVALTTSTAFFMGGSLARLLAERAPHAGLLLETTNPTSTTVFAEQGADVALLSEGFPTRFPRERLYDDRWVVITHASAPRDAGATELLAGLPHVAWGAPQDRVRPYEVLDEHKVPYTIRHRVMDNMMIPGLVANTGGVAVHRYRVATALQGYFNLRIEEFPYPIQGLGIDLVWNPWLSDQAFTAWLRQLLFDAIAAVR